MGPADFDSFLLTEQKRIKVLFFDIDGTLAETDDYFSVRLHKVVNPFLFFLDKKTTYRIAHKLTMIGQTLVDLIYWLLDILGFDQAFTNITEHLSRREDEYQYMLVAHADKIIESLSKHFRLGIITAGGEQTAAAFIKKHHLESFFEVIVSAQTTSRTKPSPMPLIYASDQMQVSPNECLMVGDTVFDLKTAQRAGAEFVGVRTGFDHDWLLKLFGAKQILDSVRDLPAFLGITPSQ